jgi:hypothetical protein
MKSALDKGMWFYVIMKPIKDVQIRCIRCFNTIATSLSRLLGGTRCSRSVQDPTVAWDYGSQAGWCIDKHKSHRSSICIIAWVVRKNICLSGQIAIYRYMKWHVQQRSICIRSLWFSDGLSAILIVDSVTGIDRRRLTRCRSAWKPGFQAALLVEVLISTKTWLEGSWADHFLNELGRREGTGGGPFFRYRRETMVEENCLMGRKPWVKAAWRNPGRNLDLFLSYPALMVVRFSVSIMDDCTVRNPSRCHSH